ncbi:MAG: hypothetical protein FWF57_05210 [Defluviitaleaceae bacterium]|nr:hypothetical protein [Defluviitaleaceae bacterium]
MTLERKIRELKQEQKGILVVEMAIYFPIIILIWLMFLVSSLIITQRVVLDGAVARATIQGASWLNNSSRIFDEIDPFVGDYTYINTNPYVNFISGLGNPFYPATEASFKAEVENRVRQYARVGIVGGLGGVIDIEINYIKNFIVGDLLTVNATQSLRMPINLSFIGITSNVFEHRASSTARILNQGANLSNLHLGFDLIRHYSGDRLDIRNLRTTIRDFPSKIPEYLLKLVGQSPNQN